MVTLKNIINQGEEYNKTLSELEKELKYLMDRCEMTEDLLLKDHKNSAVTKQPKGTLVKAPETKTKWRLASPGPEYEFVFLITVMISLMSTFNGSVLFGFGILGIMAFICFLACIYRDKPAPPSQGWKILTSRPHSSELIGDYPRYAVVSDKQDKELVIQGYRFEPRDGAFEMFKTEAYCFEPQDFEKAMEINLKLKEIAEVEETKAKEAYLEKLEEQKLQIQEARLNEENLEYMVKLLNKSALDR